MSDTRDRLIDAAYAVVARDGLEAASVKTIAAEAGVTPGLLHYHFASKDALLEAALRRGLDEYVERSRLRRAEVKGPTLFDAMLDEACAAVRDDADYFRVRLAFAARAMTHPDFAMVMRELNAVAIAETALTLAAAAGRDTATPADRAAAAALKACFDGAMLAALVDPAFSMEAAGTLVMDALRNAISLERAKSDV